MREKGLVVGGFLFSTNKGYSDAKQEEEAIDYIKANSDLSNPKTAYKLYNKLTENRTFFTPVGLFFLKELQDIIVRAGIVKLADLDGIYIQTQSGSDSDELNTLSVHHYKQIAEKSRVQNRNSRIINISLVFIIIAMIVIALYSDKTIFSKFENEVINKYASWEEDLINREQELIIREQELSESN